MAVARLSTLWLVARGAAGFALHYAATPINVGDTLYVQGSDLANATVQACSRLNGCTSLPSVGQQWYGGVKATFHVAKQDIFNITACDSSGCTANSLFVNDPRVHWWYAASTAVDASVTPGMSAELFGTNLAFSTEDGSCPPLKLAALVQAQLSVLVTFVLANGSMLTATPSFASCYRLSITVPAALPLGACDVYVNNGLDVGMGRLVASGVAVVSAASWPTTTFVVGGACGNVSSCLLAAAAAGGGIVSVPAGLYMMGDGEQLRLGSFVQLQGAGSASTQLLWASNTEAPAGALVTTASASSGPWRLLDLFINVTSVVSGQPAVDVSNCVGCAVQRVAVSVNTSALPPSSAAAGQPITVQNSQHWEVSDCTFTMLGDCSASWPRNCGFWVQSSADGALARNVWTSGCQGFSVDSSQRIMLVDNTQYSVGNDSEGSGFNTFQEPQVLEHIYHGNNTQIGNIAAYKRWESMTFDGSGGLYFGFITSASGATVTLPTNVTQPGHNYTGMALVVMGGTGIGQVGRVVSWNGATWTLRAPFATPLVANDSVVSLVGYRGRAVYDSNDYYNGTCFQYFGTAIDTYAVGNAFVNMNITNGNSGVSPAGLMAWGLNYNGYQPCFFAHVTDNSFLCGTQMASRSGGQGYAPAGWTAPYGLGHVFRNNVLLGATDWSVTGQTWDVVVERTQLGAGTCHPGWQPTPPGSGTVDNSTTMYVYVNN